MNMIGFLFVLSLMFIGMNVSAEENFYFKQSLSCYVKSYENRTFKYVDENAIVGIPVQLIQFKKAPDFIAFRANGKIYVAPKKCMSAERGNGVLTSEMAVVSSEKDDQKNRNGDWEEESYRQKEEAIERRKNERLRESSREYNALQKKYFVEIFGGKNFGGSSKPVSNEVGKYVSFTGVDDIGNGDESVTATPVSVEESQKISSGMGIGGKFGYKDSSENYYILQFKTIDSKKTEKIDYLLTSASTTLRGPLEYKWKFSGGQAYVGYAFCLSCENRIGLYLNLLGGINSITAKMNIEDELNYSLSAVTLGAELSFNLVYAVSNWLSISSNFGYDLQTGGTYKLKGTEKSETPIGFKSDMSLGGPFATMGLRVHF